MCCRIIDDKNMLIIFSVSKDVYFDKQAAEADQKKEDTSHKHPKQSMEMKNLVYFTAHMYIHLHIHCIYIV